MKIAVCAKQIPDPANPIEYSNGNVVRPDEQVLDDTDRYGIEVALQLKEKYDAEVTVISMTKVGTEKGVQQALQMGPDKALILEDGHYNFWYRIYRWLLWSCTTTSFKNFKCSMYFIC